MGDKDNMGNFVGNLAKTVFDYVATILGLISISPLMFYIAYRIKKEDSGPAIFSYDCIGKGGKKFRCYKFRSMVVNSKEVLEKHLSENPEAREEWETYYKLKNDPRITNIGQKLRKSSLDELPQLFNVLKGEMSLVGPRQIVADEIRKFGDNIKYYYSVKPGITGYWQVSGRSDVDYDTRVEMVVWYVKNRSFWMDMRILWKTISIVLKKKGAY